MLRPERTPIRGGILGDNLRLGQDAASAGDDLVFSAAKEAARDTMYKPTLIPCPSSLINNWVTGMFTQFGDPLTPWRPFHSTAAQRRLATFAGRL